VLRALGNQGMNDMSKPERAQRACLDPDAVVKFRMSFKNVTTGRSHGFGGEYRRTLTVRA